MTDNRTGWHDWDPKCLPQEERSLILLRLDVEDGPGIRLGFRAGDEVRSSLRFGSKLELSKDSLAWTNWQWRYMDEILPGGRHDGT